MLLNAAIVIGASYALYAIVLKMLGFSQYEMFYSATPVVDPYLSGPFVLHNSYATYAGMASLAALIRLVSFGSASIVATRGLRQWLLTTLYYLLGRGVGFLIAFLLCFSTLVASASRAGFLATLCGLLAALIATAFVAGRRATMRWAVAVACGLFLLIAALIALSGDTLAARLNSLVEAGNADALRLVLWSAATRMIKDAPLLGLGLGTFQDAYPLYANQIEPYIMDRAHNDYLEFAAGLGLPAAAAWWAAWAWLAGICARGVAVRRRNQHFAVMAVAASVLIGVHSAFDFSLQIPAVALSYVTFLGIGLAQSQPTQARS
jgi:O-antigen ligase